MTSFSNSGGAGCGSGSGSGVVERDEDRGDEEEEEEADDVLDDELDNEVSTTVLTMVVVPSCFCFSSYLGGVISVAVANSMQSMSAREADRDFVLPDAAAADPAVAVADSTRMS